MGQVGQILAQFGNFNLTVERGVFEFGDAVSLVGDCTLFLRFCRGIRRRLVPFFLACPAPLLQGSSFGLFLNC
jgi:hypothetical protein